MVSLVSMVESHKPLPCMFHDETWFLTCSKPTSGTSTKRFAKLHGSCFERWCRAQPLVSKLGDWVLKLKGFYSLCMLWFPLTPFAIRLMLLDNQGPLITIESFHPSHISFCSMHSINLGYALWVSASTLVLLVEQFGVWGGDEVDLPDRYKSAWLHFNGWSVSRKIQQLRYQIKLICTSHGCGFGGIMKSLNTQSWGIPKAYFPRNVVTVHKEDMQNSMQKRGMFLGTQEPSSCVMILTSQSLFWVSFLVP